MNHSKRPTTKDVMKRQSGSRAYVPIGKYLRSLSQCYVTEFSSAKCKYTSFKLGGVRTHFSIN